MKPSIGQLAFAGACLLAAVPALAGGVSVTLTKPEQYSDIPFTPWDREEVLNGITEHFEKLGQKLPADQDLKIEVLDVDMAGREIPGARTGRELRVLNGRADWPRMRLRYSLESQGKVLASGEAQLSDMAYLNRSPRYADGELLRYEKQMIDDWFKQTFLAAH